MTRLYDFLSKLSGCLALVCAILAVLATPSTSRADQLGACDACCGQMYGYGNPDYGQCVSLCMERAGPCGDAYASSCPNADPKACHVNDMFPNSCPGTVCSNGTKYCDCTYDTSNKTCNCPP